MVHIYYHILNNNNHNYLNLDMYWEQVWSSLALSTKSTFISNKTVKKKQGGDSSEGQA